MKNVLFAWELGENFGHVSHQLPLALRLRQEGIHPIFTVRDPRVAEALLRPYDLTVELSPAPKTSLVFPGLPVNYSDILLHYGYSYVPLLIGLTKQWLTLFERHRIDLVVAENAPTAQLAARVARLPTIMVGTGFGIPPAECNVTPCVRPWSRIPSSHLQHADWTATERINATLVHFSAPPITCVSDIFPAEDTLLFTLPELDHYDCSLRPRPNYFGPIGAANVYTAGTWSDVHSQRIFAYVRARTPGIAELLRSLNHVEAASICVIPDITPELRKLVSSDKVKILTSPVGLRGTLMHADVSIGYGTGTLTQSLLSGVPTLSLPLYAEQTLFATRIEALHAGMTIQLPSKVTDYINVINQLLHTPAFRESARTFAAKYANYDVDAEVLRASALVAARANTRV